MMDLEEQVMGIIVNSGQARSLCYEGLRFAKSGQFAKARERLAEASSFAKKAHAVQTKLIEEDEGEGKMKMTLIMVHAQDHLMTSMLAQELISELIELHQKLAEQQSVLS